MYYSHLAGHINEKMAYEMYLHSSYLSVETF